MRVIDPIIITGSALNSSTVPEEVAATYSGAATYNAGDLRGEVPVYGQPQTVWESLQDSNNGNAQETGDWWKNRGVVYPVYDSGSSCDIGGIVTDLATHSLYKSLVDGNTSNALTDEAKWEFFGPTNKWAMFYYERNRATTAPGSITAVFAPGKRAKSIALSGIVANSYSLTVTSASFGGEIYSASGSLNKRETLTWSNYFFGEFSTQKELVFFDLPPYSDAVFTLTLTATSGNASIEACVVGNDEFLGATQYNALSGAVNYSTVERDSSGNAILNRVRNIPKINVTALSAKTRVNKIREIRGSLNGVPAYWFSIDDPNDGYFEALSMLAYYRNFSINVSMPNEVETKIELEEI